jgi:EAL domain-containing protein (putative c-di-GMP-specific phosphodiesterase class I)
MSTAASAEGQLRTERDLFVAFAFCGNDMLVDLLPSGAIHRAYGATDFLTGQDAQKLTGASFARLFAGGDQWIVERAIEAAVSTGKRFDAVPGNIESPRGPVRVELTGFVVPQLKGHCLVALRRARAAPVAVETIEPEGPDAPEQVDAVRRVIDLREFDLAFQPVVSLDTNGIHHMEALLRMRPAVLEMSTFKFVQLAERHGLVAEMDLAIVDAAIRRLLEVAEKGRPTSVAVNISGTSIETPDFAKRLDVLLSFRKTLNRLIIIEIIDSGGIRNMRVANEFVQNLRGRGFKVTLDDFGARGAGFEQLRHIDIDFVKIDGKFIRESRHSERGKVFVMAMATLCRQLGVTAIAEQVEDPDSVAFLRECGIPYGQGFVFGKPMLDPDLLVGESMSDIRWRRDSASVRSMLGAKRA